MPNAEALANRHAGESGPSSDVRDFVFRFLRTCQASVVRVGPILRVSLPQWVADELNLRPQFDFTFDTEHADADVLVMAHGSPVLDGMIQLARQRGLSCTLMLAGVELHRKLHHLCAMNPWSEVQPGISGALSKICFLNAKVRGIERRILHQEEMLFHFKVAYISDERVEELHPMLLDPLHERVAYPLDLANSFFLNLPMRPRSIQRQSSPRSSSMDVNTKESWAHGDQYIINRLYRIACEHLEHTIQPQLRRRMDEANKRMEVEFARVKEYYYGLARECSDPLRRILRRIAGQRARAQVHLATRQSLFSNELDELQTTATEMEAAYRAELAHLEIEQKRRLAELEERYRVRVEVVLTNVARVRVPRIEWSLRLSGPVRRDLLFLHDVQRDRLIDLDCESCGEPMAEVALCSCEAVTCGRCMDEHKHCTG